MAVEERYCREWLAQFRAESPSLKSSFQGMLVDFTFKVGQVEQALALLEQSRLTGRTTPGVTWAWPTSTRICASTICPLTRGRQPKSWGRGYRACQGEKTSESCNSAWMS